VVEDITAKLKKEVPDLAYENLRKPYTISGLKALLGRYGYVQNELIRIEDKDSLNNQEYRSRLLKESGVEEFEKDLMKYLFNGNRVEKLLDSHFRYLQDFMHRIETCLKNRMETLEGDVSLEELDQKLERLEYEIKKQKDEMNRTTDSLVNKLDLSLGNAITAIEQNLDSKYQELKDTLEGIQEFSELAVNWDDGMKLSTVATGMLEMLRHKAVNYLGEAVTSVFREYDRRLRAKLSAGLQEHGILNLPELPEVNITFTAPNLSGELEEELIATREKIQQIDQEIDNYYNHSDPDVKIRYNELLESKKSCRIDYEQKIHKLGMRPQVVRYEKEVTKTRWRRGALGIMTTILCGKEDYTDFETICDSSAQEEYDDIVGKIEKECDSQLKKYSSKLNDLGRQLSAEQKQERLAGRKKDLRRQLEQTKFEMEKRFHSKKAREEKRALQKCMNGIKRSFTAGAETIRLILGESRNKCRQWADDYVANLMVELDEVTADSRFEFENLKTLQADSIEKRDKTLQILNKLEVKLTVVREKYDSALDLFSALDLTI
jgi:Skp family chaperone for outer membrane proteins